ncbi:MAG TPA: cytochrome c peroxidase [Acidimicrobiia bacterium]|nr:cytochrome c peroxidase [Acidimicrobiia bacterium]
MRPRWPWLVVMPLAVSIAVIAAAWNTRSAEPANAAAVLGPVPVPADNPQTPEKVALGKLLFFDPRLSGGNTIACATCHRAGTGLTDGLPRSIGASGEMTRNAMTLWNVAYMHAIHSDGSRASLEEQADKAIPGPAMAQPYPALLAELGAVPEYRQRFGRAFPDGITEANIAKSIAAFERTLLTFNSPYDRYRAGDKGALTAEQKEGLDLFFSSRTGCSSCHVAPLFTDNAFHNLGVPQVGPKVVDNGRSDITHNPADLGAFKTLTLRNVELTGPYMHDGVFATLDQVVAFYVGGGGPSPNKDPLIRPLDLDTKEQKALVAFLRSLTDPTARLTPPKLP